MASSRQLQTSLARDGQLALRQLAVKVALGCGHLSIIGSGAGTAEGLRTGFEQAGADGSTRWRLRCARAGRLCAPGDGCGVAARDILHVAAEPGLLHSKALVVPVGMALKAVGDLSV